LEKINYLAIEYSFPVADVYSATKNREELFVDGVHLNDLGAQVVANIINDAFFQYLPDPSVMTTEADTETTTVPTTETLTTTETTTKNSESEETSENTVSSSITSISNSNHQVNSISISTFLLASLLLIYRKRRHH